MYMHAVLDITTCMYYVGIIILFVTHLKCIVKIMHMHALYVHVHVLNYC